MASTNTIDNDDLIDVSSEDDGTESMGDVINKMIKSLDTCPKEKLEKLEKLNKEVISHYSESSSSSDDNK